MTPDQAIGMLDRQLARHGETVRFARAGIGPVDMPAFVRGYKPNELVGLLRQGDRVAVISPSGLGALGGISEQDRAVIAGHPVTVIAVETIRIAGTVVRINATVRG